MLKILNFRPLAKGAVNKVGKKIKPNSIFRSGALAYAAKTDIKKLKSLGINDIYDFRSKKEISSMPALPDSLFNTHHYDILQEAANSGTKSYLKMSKEELNNRGVDLYLNDFVNTLGYKGIISEILYQENPCFLFHCTAGKDRTGVFGAILMMILDFDSNEIKKEYLIINKRAMRILGKQMLKKAGVNPKHIDISKFDGVMGVLPEFIDAYFKKILNDYNSFDEYLEDKVGVTFETKELMKKRYLV